ncbi:MAG: SdrD B-like domain-containing protein [Pirellulaceae bacterium]
MGLFSNLLSWPRRRRSQGKQCTARNELHRERHCTFEVMEARRLLAANPITLGTVYIEEDLGSDLHGDHFEVQFTGGAAGTELTRLVINGDRGAPGLSLGDVIFDTVATGMGADAAAPFRVEQLISSNPDARVEAHVNDGDAALILDFYGFRAGDKLVFSIDVDEIQFFEPGETDLHKINDGIDPITSGVEFQGTELLAWFSAPHYQDANGNSIFWNRYDAALDASGLDLSADNVDGKRDRTTGAFLNVQQVVNPAALSGYVYADNDNDGIRDSGEPGLAGVSVRVIPVDTLAPQQAINLITNAQGFYEATNLSPGTYRIVQTQQPAGYLDGLDTAGTVAGVPRGKAVNPGDNIEDIFLSGGTRGIEYNFGEILPASLEGSVHLSDDEGNCFVTESTCEPLSGVTVKLLDQRGQVVAQTQTDAAGHYAFAGLVPGMYSVIEITPAGMIDAGANAGTVGTTVRGRVVDANTITDIQLHPGDQGYEYDFCEHLPSSLSGYVYHDRNDNGVREGGEEAIAGVTVTLYQQDGTQLAVTQTNAQGRYEFTALSAGLYRLVESQPAHWLDGRDTPGTIEGRPSGSIVGNDILQVGHLGWRANGVDFNFGELLPGTLQGSVHADLDGDGHFDANEPAIASVKIELLDEHGSVRATTLTNASGEYRFEHILPGRYTVRETQPDGYFQGSQRAGSHGGNASVIDLISQVPIGSDQHLTDYDFWEILPGSISGIVFVDPNQNGQRDSGETLLAGVTVQLLDATGSVVATAQTNTVGYYEFKNLRPGDFGVHELQPTGYFHGGQWAGSHGGNDTVDDFITAITIGAGAELTHYNFSEIPPSSVAGIVYVTTPDSAVPNRPLADVTLELLNKQGQVLRTTRTDQQGRYQFDLLPPGEYTVRESQPANYFQGGQEAGSGGGVDTVPDLISAIAVPAGVQLVNYNFYEIPPSSLSGYVFQDGAAIRTNSGVLPDNLAAIRDGRRSSDDRPLAGVVVELRDGLTGVPIMADHALPGTYAAGPLTAVTDARGFYEFVGLPSGSYAVYEIQPTQYLDGIDTAGTTSGIPFNVDSPALQELIRNLAKDPARDAIVQIPLMAGQASLENNFSEVLVERIPPPLEEPPTNPPVLNPFVFVVPPSLPWIPAPVDMPHSISTIPVYGAGGIMQMAWHLSVVDGGSPRTEIPHEDAAPGRWRTVSHLSHTQWVSVAMQKGYWIMPTGPDRATSNFAGLAFGLPGAVPISGDFNGDGICEVGLYHEGQWYIDLNGNGRWDEEDLWAQLGNIEDLPVVGDWDGDGKDDIGIFGPEWPGDERAIVAEPGLPGPQNVFNRTEPNANSTPKNLPPEPAEATEGLRLLKRTAEGAPREDVIDHVFRYGINQDLPVAGDWNGDGIRSIGVFRAGTWFLDIDGDGRHTHRDTVIKFGTDGDLPVVGDFNADGIDELGVFRDGTWHLDVNGNQELDAHDEVFRLGQEGDIPVVGDWDGDGRDDPAVYREAG